MTRLDALIERARGATVERGAAERYVHELERWARTSAAPASGPRRWWPWLAAGLGAGLAAAAIVALLIIRAAAPDLAWALVRIGPRVAIVADPSASYRVLRADDDTTAVAVDHGSVTARLWPGARPHRLTLAGLGVTATATGTIYSLAIGPAGPVVHVVEGTVTVRAADGLHAVHTAETWPPTGTAANLAGGRILLALASPTLIADPTAIDPTAAGPGTTTSIDAAGGAGGTDAGGAGSSDAGSNGTGASAIGSGAIGSSTVASPVHGGAALSIKDRWRGARLLRGQGKFAAALAECIAIAGAHDPTWSPIALIEAVRIALGPLADPEQAITLAERMLHDWPTGELAAEARALRCRALDQLGRASECGDARPK